MAKNLISVKGNEIYYDGVTIIATKDGTDNARLIIEFIVQSEPEHKPYSVYEKDNKRDFFLASTGKGITSDYYNVTTADINGDQTKFRVEVKIESKIPGTGGGFLELSDSSLKKKK